MAGIYLHIPFCKKACHYCDFHFSTSLAQKENMVLAIVAELSLQKDYLNKETVETIYFGGGTPSLLSKLEIELILNIIYQFYSVARHPEITLEANPEDLTKAKLNDLKSIGINRLSIGIQTFDDEKLKWMNRNHTSKEACQCVEQAQNVGFDNLSLDLIYGIPHPDHQIWENDLSTIIKLAPKHISAYNLTIEPKTAFGKWKNSGKITEATDEFSLQQYELLINAMSKNKYQQYEISNFCQSEFYSKHNSAYWLGKKYLGIGPSAHSYDLSTRHSNIANNSLYIKNIAAQKGWFEIENLSQTDQFNDYLITRLRTKWGLDLDQLKKFTTLELSEFYHHLKNHLTKNNLSQNEQTVYLTENGKIIADKIIRDLFLV